MLTDNDIKAAKPREMDYKLADAGGLYLFVTPRGHRSWRIKYRREGKERRLVLGAYPELTLKRVRPLREEAKMALRQGSDPMMDHRRRALVGTVSSSDNFERFAREWYELQKYWWRPVHANDVITSLKRDLFPQIGGFRIPDIDAPLLLAALKKVQPAVR